jgi:hypothetical protein
MNSEFRNVRDLGLKAGDVIENECGCVSRVLSRDPIACWGPRYYRYRNYHTGACDMTPAERWQEVQRRAATGYKLPTWRRDERAWLIRVITSCTTCREESGSVVQLHHWSNCRRTVTFETILMRSFGVEEHHVPAPQAR